MKRRGSATGNGAGWPTRRADSAGMSQTESVAARNSSRPMVERPRRTRSMRPFEKHRQYSCTSRNVGLAADCHEPHAHEPLAPSAFRHTTSPRMKKPSCSVISRVTSDASGT